MFDAVTAQLLRSAPELPGLDPNTIPQLLTAHYAALVSERLSGIPNGNSTPGNGHWSLERIADTYELISSVNYNSELRSAAAFVAGTAQQILSRKAVLAPTGAQPWNVNRDRVDPTIASALLFLAAEQYADAAEAATLISAQRGGQPYEVATLSEHIRNLARGQLPSILERAVMRRVPTHVTHPLQHRAFLVLLEALISGIELLASWMLSRPVPGSSEGRFHSARDAFLRVLELASNADGGCGVALGGELLTSYPGPRHLASLLLSAHNGIKEAALTRLSPPIGADTTYWGKWLRHRAETHPFVWPNHRKAIDQRFHDSGSSAVLVLPTGAGKTTVSALKIAGVLAQGKKVIFLVPTHALVEQLTEDLREIFPADILGSDISSDFDVSYLINFRGIEVMTPEACLAMISFAPAVFAEVGLRVFDECHLLSPEAGNLRRSLDAMLCLLAFNRAVPDGDMLFLSAMLKNGDEFAKWIEDLTGRRCLCVELLWKPSRQARGVVIYKADELIHAKRNALSVQANKDKLAGKRARSLRKAARDELSAKPFAIWGLQHNWLSEAGAECSFTQLLSDPVPIGGDLKYGRVHLTPNANGVAARLAAAAAKNGVKVIVFVNTKMDAVSTARTISDEVGEPVLASTVEQERWDALAAELGDLKHSLMPGSATAVPHNASMLRLRPVIA